MFDVRNTGKCAPSVRIEPGTYALKSRRGTSWTDGGPNITRNRTVYGVPGIMCNVQHTASTPPGGPRVSTLPLENVVPEFEPRARRASIINFFICRERRMHQAEITKRE